MNDSYLYHKGNRIKIVKNTNIKRRKIFTAFFGVGSALSL